MSADLNTMFAEALAARPVRRGEVAAGIAYWRAAVFAAADGFRFAHPEWLAWLKNEEHRARETYPGTGRNGWWDTTRPARRRWLAMSILWYRRRTPIAERPSISHFRARDGELRRVFEGE